MMPEQRRFGMHTVLGERNFRAEVGFHIGAK
jgi:hypothetical protein